MYHEQKMLIPLIILIYQTVLNSEKIDNSFCTVRKNLIISLGGGTSYISYKILENFFGY